MPITRSFQNQNEVQDYTQELLIVPNEWGFVNNLNIFNEEGVTSNSILIEKISQDGTVLLDKVRGERATYNKDYTREVRAFAIPHFPMDDFILPSDIQGKRAYGSADAADTLDAVRARKLERIRRTHAWTLEKARMQLLTAGTVYAPGNTVEAANFYTELGVASQVSVDFVLGTTSTNIISKCEAVIAQIQDNLGNGGMMTGVVGLCSPAFFTKLINHDAVKDAYKYYSSVQEPMRNRVGGNTTMFREFFFGGIRFVEYRGAYGGNALITAGDVSFFPTGVDDMFETYYAPANKFEFTNTVGMPAYVFEYASTKGDKIELESESNFINVCRRPGGLVKGTTSN
jgi:hypothetical protein